MKLKKGDKVMVIAGKAKGQTAAIVRAFPKRDLVVLDNVNLVKRHRKPSAANRMGQIIDKPMPIHVSNVQLVDPKGGKPTRIRIKRDEKGGRSRVAAKSGESLK